MGPLMLLAGRLYGTPLMVLPDYAQVVQSVLAHRMGTEPLAAAPEITRRPAREPALINGILVLPVVGGLYHRGDSLDAISGAQSYTNLQNMFLMGLRNADVKGILLDIDSPGGMIAGLFEFCQVIQQASGTKPVRAIANSLCASAAYAMAAACDHVYAIPSATVGSIGVLTMHRDVSKAMEQAGLKVTLIFAGDHKVDGNPYEPLPKSVRADVQASIDEAYDKFVAYVADRRPMSERDVRGTQARTFTADDAAKNGLVDTVATFDEAVADFAAAIASPQAPPKQTGTNAMSGTQAGAAPANDGGMQAAIDRAFADGKRAGEASSATAATEAYARGRADAVAIINHAEAAGREAFAAELAGDAGMTVERAGAYLAKAPKAEDGSGFQRQLAKDAPNVAVGADQGAKTPQPAADQFQNSVNAHLRSMLGIKQQ